MGSLLIVAINSDAGVRRLKGDHRPIIGQNERGEMLGALECVDYVAIFEEDTSRPLLELLKPDIFVKGGATPVVVEADVAKGCGARIETLSLVGGLSTTKIIERVLAAHDNKNS